MVNELRNKIYNLQANISDPIHFEKMLTNSTLTFNSTSVLIWFTLGLISSFYLIFMIMTFVYYLKQRKNLTKTTKFSNSEANTQYDAIQMQPLIQDLGKVLIHHHTTNRNPTQIRLAL
jgi:hypothetical protein